MFNQLPEITIMKQMIRNYRYYQKYLYQIIVINNLDVSEILSCKDDLLTGDAPPVQLENLIKYLNKKKGIPFKKPKVYEVKIQSDHIST